MKREAPKKNFSISLEQFKSDIVKAAKKALKQSTHSIREQFGGRKIVYVGIHARRGDYAHNPHLTDFYTNDNVWRAYFLHCINLFRARIDNETTKSVFVMLSDEKLWLKNNFENEPDVGFPGYYSLISEERMPARDMYILMLCKHLIRTYGTFGIWGGFWSKGTVMYSYTGRGFLLYINMCLVVHDYVYDKLYKHML
ncbi:galactoside 2-alpha-L-fucosyltransferase 2 [Eurytemora carolleeae]|uniref:galactoside 2-alpha-L-fucosyltransferase 2 n=1 Tax=Eurytemora carolleeae TaxID=1294199 RepID=UPI000C775B25|nr:galactoside 2-alpha-L-fucosyltransferase 2 [Eurytemora carolleeae]|eukprot:XP_023324569.1 galactoside 2-alpha-L-fucosyltransferase 2-like [Eurytemora affinis]